MPSVDTWQLSEESKSIYHTISYFNVFSRQQNKNSFPTFHYFIFLLSLYPSSFCIWIQLLGSGGK